MSKTANLNFQYDYSPVILWQYSEAKKLKAIVDNEQKFLDVAVTKFIKDFEKDLFNLDTCNADGLELWGKLLQVSRPRLNGVDATDEQYRLLLKARIYVLVWDGTAFGLTRLIRYLFPNILFRVIDCPVDSHGDNQIMKVKIEFSDGLTAEQEAVLSMGYLDPLSGKFVYTFLPRPAGVEYEINFGREWNTVLGFAEQINPDGTWTGMTETTNMGDEDNPNTGGVFYK